MKTSTKVILAGLAVTVLAGSAVAAEGWRRHGPGAHARMGKAMFDKVDTDKDGAVSREELMQAFGERFDKADADTNASVTKAEIIAAVEANAPFERAKRFSGRIADRIVYQLDLDDNGSVARAEAENRIGKVFALFDRNDDGKVDQAEVRRMASMSRGGRHGGMRHHGGEGRWGGKGWGAKPNAMDDDMDRDGGTDAD